MADQPPGEPRAERRRNALDRRGQSAQSRLAAADVRDASADARDVAAAARDEVATARQRALTLRLAGSRTDGEAVTSASEWIIRAAGSRKRADRMRADSAVQGAFALHDRQDAAQDREQAARERLHALVDREVLADALADAEVDPLTGARMRAAGLADLDRELLCCNRTGRALVVAYVDVVGLKALNDREGHGAGDDLLVGVVTLLKQHLRAYDLIIRVGGDEFLCAMTGLGLHEAKQRFDQIAEVLARAPGGASIRAGFAELADGDTTVELIARADGQLIGRAHDPHTPRTGRRALHPGD